MPNPFLIADLRGGRNGSDPPLLLADNECVEAMNVDWSEGTLAHRRGGATAIGVAFSSGGPFSGAIQTLQRFVPDTDETEAEYWAVDAAGQFGRLAASTLWSEILPVDAVVNPAFAQTAGLQGLMAWAYDSSENRMHVWDGNSLRRMGIAQASAPTVATNGGAGLTFTRFYRIRWAVISGSDTERISEPSASATITITDDASVRVTRPAVIGEGETHWIVEYAEADAGPWYVVTTIAVATTFYDDADATVDDTLDESDEDGLHTAPPSFKYVVKAGGRFLFAGCWETSGGSFVPLSHEVYWTPIFGALDIGDLERVPPSYRVALDHAVTGLSEALNGVHYAFGPKGVTALIPTDAPGAGAFRRVTERNDIGCLDFRSIVSADDGNGNPAIYFWSHRGPYRITNRGIEYIGKNIEDLRARINWTVFTPVIGVGYHDQHQVWWGLTLTESAVTTPTLRVVYDTQTGGWSLADGAGAEINAFGLISTTLGTSMSIDLKPCVAPSDQAAIWRCDEGTDDAGTDFRAYVDTKEYAPAGLANNCSIREPHIIAEANAIKSVYIEPRVDFGRRTSESATINLAPEASETHVQKKCEGLDLSGFGTVRFRIGDAAETDPGFGTIDAFVGMYDGEQAR